MSRSTSQPLFPRSTRSPLNMYRTDSPPPSPPPGGEEGSAEQSPTTFQSGSVHGAGANVEPTGTTLPGKTHERGTWTKARRPTTHGRSFCRSAPTPRVSRMVFALGGSSLSSGWVPVWMVFANCPPVSGVQVRLNAGAPAVFQQRRARCIRSGKCTCSTNGHLPNPNPGEGRSIP
eukprot:gene10480-biopygen4775